MSFICAKLCSSHHRDHHLCPSWTSVRVLLPQLDDPAVCKTRGPVPFRHEARPAPSRHVRRVTGSCHGPAPSDGRLSDPSVTALRPARVPPSGAPAARALQPHTEAAHPGYMSRQTRNFRTDKFDRETNRSFDSCISCKRLVPSRLHELHESYFCLFHASNLFVLNFEFFRLMYPGSMLQLEVRRAGCHPLSLPSAANITSYEERAGQTCRKVISLRGTCHYAAGQRVHRVGQYDHGAINGPTERQPPGPPRPWTKAREASACRVPCRAVLYRVRCAVSAVLCLLCRVLSCPPAAEGDPSFATGAKRPSTAGVYRVKSVHSDHNVRFIYGVWLKFT